VAAQIWSSAYQKGQERGDQVKADAQTGKARAQAQAQQVKGKAYDQETDPDPDAGGQRPPGAHVPGARRN